MNNTQDLQHELLTVAEFEFKDMKEKEAVILKIQQVTCDGLKLTC